MGKNINIFEFNKILIVGNNGSGKSYLSRKLGEITQIPIIHLDNEYWQPNWETPNKEEWNNKIDSIIEKDSWIIDGMHTSTLNKRFKKAELIIFLDINRITCLLGVLRRRGKKRTDMPAYLEEKIDKNYIKFCRGLWNFNKIRKKQIVELHKNNPNKAFLVLSSRREVEKIISELINCS